MHAQDAGQDSARLAAVHPAEDGKDVSLKPDSLNPNPGWALDRVGENFPDGNSFTYPDTTNPVRLYLIDTAVANPAGFVAANPKLTFEGTIYEPGANDPQVSTPRAHGTQLLSLIAGAQTGIAAGTPIHVLNYDIYPNEGVTTKTLLTNAILSAVEHSKAPGTQQMRSAILIATSSAEPTSSFALEDAIQYALSEGIPVIVTAGNLGQDASNFVPSEYGFADGVICVGASDLNDTLLAGTNFGDSLDLLAPGENVRTRDNGGSSSDVPMTGTSPAAALVAGCVLTELSINGSLTPEQVEDALKASAKPSASGPPLLRTTSAASASIAAGIAIANPDGPVIPPASPAPLAFTEPPAAFRVAAASAIPAAVTLTASQDDDSDGMPDMIEIFHKGGTTGRPPAPVLIRAANQEVRFKFPVAFGLFNSAQPFALGNGYRWGIRCTSDFKNWEVPVGSLEKSTDSNGQVWLTASFPAGQSSCFVRIEVQPAAP